MAEKRELPARLPPAGSDNVLFQHHRTSIAVRLLMQSALEGTEVSGEEYAILGVVHFFPDRTPTELANALGVPPTSVSRHVARFVDDGLVEKRPNPDDGRSYVLRTTKRGGKVVETIAPRIAENVRAIGAASRRPLGDIADALLALEEAARAVAAERQ
jgi:DNA-binding MarR family transcriptional regulator